VPLDGVEAKLKTLSETAARQRAKAARTRPLKRPDSELEFFFIVRAKGERCGFLGARLVFSVFESHLKTDAFA